MYYDYDRILSYNAFLNILIGERGVGKTYGASKFVTKQFLKKNEEFAYIRRYKPELSQAVPHFFDALNQNEEFPNNHLFSKGNSFFCNEQKFGYALRLSTAQDLKSVNFNKVKTVIFDEFIIEEGQKKYYLKNEVFTFLNLLETIGRLRDIRVFMLANAVTITNPYFLYFNLHLPYNSDIELFKNGLILVQYMKNEEYRETKKHSRFGQLVEGTSFADYAIDNKFIQDNNNFIEKKQGTAKFMFAFIIKNEILGVWIDYHLGKMYISQDYNKNTPYIFSTTLENHSDNTLFLNSARRYNCWRKLLDNFELGNLRFENQKIKNISMELIKKLLTI